MTAGERIKKARKEKGLTQKQLGELSGTSEITIRQYELGKRQPRLAQLRQIAAALEVSMDYLSGWADSEEFQRITEVSQAWAEANNNLKNQMKALSEAHGKGLSEALRQQAERLAGEIQAGKSRRERLNTIYEELDEEDAQRLVDYGELLVGQDKYKTPPEKEKTPSHSGEEDSD